MKHIRKWLKMAKPITIKDKLKIRLLEESVTQLQWALYFWVLVALGILTLLIIVALSVIH